MSVSLYVRQAKITSLLTSGWHIEARQLMLQQCWLDACDARVSTYSNWLNAYICAIDTISYILFCCSLRCVRVCTVCIRPSTHAVTNRPGCWVHRSSCSKLLTVCHVLNNQILETTELPLSVFRRITPSKMY